MIHYHLWLSNDPVARSAKAHRNDVSAAWIYANLKPLRAFVGGVFSAIQLGLQTWRALSRRRAAIRELKKLDDRILKDIGVSRGQIPGIVRTGSRRTKQNQSHPEQPKVSRPLAGPRQACEVIVLDTARQSADGQSMSGENNRPVRWDQTAA